MPSKLTVPMTCARCGAAFLAPKPTPSLGSRKFCSLTCAWETSARTLEEKFWPRVVQTDGCWEWAGATSAAGYGQINHRGVVLYAHRVSWELRHGPIPPSTEVCHTCDNRACVRPDHHFLGSHALNMADRDAKGRTNTSGLVRALPGEAHYAAKLTEADVHAIRARGSETHSALARDFGVSRPTITALLTGRTWAHVPL